MNCSAELMLREGHESEVKAMLQSNVEVRVEKSVRTISCCLPKLSEIPQSLDVDYDR